MPKVNYRRNGDGTEKWFVRFRLNGVQTTLTFPAEHDAQQYARDVEQRGAQWAWDNYQREEEEGAEMTLGEWAPRFLESLTNVSPATLGNYRRDWRLRWEPHLGHLQLSRITREDIAAALKAQTGADKTVENAWGTLAAMFKTAVTDGHLDRTPTAGIKLGRRTEHEQAEHRYLTPDEVHQVIDDTPERYKPLIWMLVGTGMRWGEATALLVGDVDLAKRTVRVTKAWKHDRENKRWYVGPPKTRKARRTITLPGEVAEAIEPLTVGRKRGDLLFTNRNGDMVKHQPFYREHWVKRCTANIDEPRPRIHDLRHSHVAILMANGVYPPVIQARLGHEKITTTIDTYGHLMPDLQVAAADAADRALSRHPVASALPPGGA